MTLRELARDTILESMRTTKTASVIQDAQLFELAQSGMLGEAAQLSVQHLEAAAKTASTPGAGAGHSVALSIDNLLSDGWQSGLDENSRKRRLAESLKKREATDTDGGSASPNPPGAL